LIFLVFFFFFGRHFGPSHNFIPGGLGTGHNIYCGVFGFVDNLGGYFRSSCDFGGSTLASSTQVLT
jgi:hypothetical protein